MAALPRIHYANSHDSNMFYVIGMHVPDGFFLIEKEGKKYVFLDHREYGTFKERNTNPDIELVLVSAAERMKTPAEFGHALFERYGLLGAPVAVPKNFPLDMADFLRSKGATLLVEEPFYPERLVKRPEEIEMLRESLRRTHVAFRRIEEILRESSIQGDTLVYRGAPLSSEFVKKEVSRVLLEEDMVNVEGLIVSCGPHAAIPHHGGSGLLRPHQTIVCDIFPRRHENGYFADMTRTYVKGQPRAKIQEMYEAVLRSQEKGFEFIKPGAVGGDVHRACAQVMLDRGFDVGDKGFTHGTGHGLGLDIHEPPYLNASSTTPLAPGHVVSVEPGLYYPEWGGVRIEDIVAVTENGCENLTNYHKEYIIP